MDRWVKTQADRSLWIGLSRERLATHCPLCSPPLRLLRLICSAHSSLSPGLSPSLALVRELSLFCAHPALYYVLLCFARIVLRGFVCTRRNTCPPRRLSPLLVYPYKRGGETSVVCQDSVLSSVREDVEFSGRSRQSSVRGPRHCAAALSWD